MKIGIFLCKIDPNYFGGVNSYVMGLLEGFKDADKNNEYVFFVSEKNKNLFAKFEGHNFKIKELNVKWERNLLVDYLAILPIVRIFFPVIYKIVSRKLISTINSSPIDVLYCPHEFPIYWQKPTVVSIHDIQFVHFPKFFSIGQRWHREVFYKNTVRGAVVVQASSEYIKQDFIKYFGVSSKKIVVITDGINKIFKKEIVPEHLQIIKNKYNLQDSFIFYPAQHWPHKNHLSLIRAINFLKQDKKIEVNLVLTGEKKKEASLVYKEIENLGLDKNIKMIGNIAFEDLPYLYKLATMVVIPSIHESNSLPAMESLAIGCPVVASNIEPNIELNKNNSITIFDKNDYKDMAEKIYLLLKNKSLLEEKAKDGRKLSDDFSWEKTAKNYISTFEKINNDNNFYNPKSI